ncbi:MAG: exosome complex protein Rrp42 [Candidatus Diapherotrites archaeon]|nr:exosome complex protein Rrp42 [Candidatus Diapherotrites archaeon]MDZ4256129.1 exosome complex protein Rrp42 [archaeon]
MTQIDVLVELQSAKTLVSLRGGKREDGRALDEYRDISFQTGVSQNANGSARVQLGKTDVIAGVKFGIGTPYPDTPNEGAIAVGLELTPLASPQYEVGPPQPKEVELARVVDRCIRESHAIDTASLCLIPGEQVLMMFIDMYALNDDGNMFDAASMAALLSLNQTRLPKVEDGKIVDYEYAGNLKLANQPLLTTHSKAAGLILADPRRTEEHAQSARFSFGSTEKGILCAFQKGGSGSFSPSELEQTLDMGLANAKTLRKRLKV